MKKFILTAVAASFGMLLHAQVYMSTSSSTTFYSYTPMENIDATSDKGTYMIVSKDGTHNVIGKVEIKSFHFKNGLMEEHFNENYMETDKEGPKGKDGKPTYPNKFATFKGKINESVNLEQDGVHDVTITGKLNIHGVEKDKTIKAKLTIAGGKITVDSKFNVPLKDHNIKVPEAVGAKIAEVIQVTVKAVLEEKKK